ncbi:MAG TPA: hypothetical protein DIU35_07540 [Candidatus Latescibacteria bacterium]|nr:hypothetical protein [Candidatus Latescibacterota bacterium]
MAHRIHIQEFRHHNVRIPAQQHRGGFRGLFYTDHLEAGGQHPADQLRELIFVHNQYTGRNRRVGLITDRTADCCWVSWQKLHTMPLALKTNVHTFR